MHNTTKANPESLRYSVFETSHELDGAQERTVQYSPEL